MGGGGGIINYLDYRFLSLYYVVSDIAFRSPQRLLSLSLFQIHSGLSLVLFSSVRFAVASVTLAILLGFIFI